MPSPWLIARKSGLYCRVFVPTDLRPVIGQRFLVRALDARDRDQARLVAAHYALAIGELFRLLRKELSMAEPKVEDILRTIQSGGTREAMTIRGLVSAEGHPVEVVLDTPQDIKAFNKVFPGLIQAPKAGTGYVPPIPIGGYHLSAEQAVVISKRIQEFEDEQKDDHRTKKYIDECRRAIEILIDICGDLPPNDYLPQTVTHFKSRVKWLPLNAEKGEANLKRWSDRTHAQRSEEVELEELPHIKKATVTKHINRLSAFFDFCSRQRYLTSPNPFFERASKRSKINGGAENAVAERQAFDMPDLERIFDPTLYKTRKLPHSFWPPLIALMTGARVNEIAQLYLADIVDDDRDNPGRWRFMILAKEKDQRVKNPSSLRSIPMHPKLIELGFLTYLQDVKALGYKRVFPTLLYTEASGYGDSVSEFFLGYLRDKVNITDRTKVFHSFRYYFSNQLFRYSQKERMHIVGMTGHAREGVFERTYAGELHYEEKMAILMKLKLPEIQIEPYQAGGFVKYFNSYERNKAARLRRKAEKEAQAAMDVAKLEAGGQGETPQAVGTEPVAEPKRFTLKATRKRTIKPEKQNPAKS
jgi:integrase